VKGSLKNIPTLIHPPSQCGRCVQHSSFKAFITIFPRFQIAPSSTLQKLVFLDRHYENCCELVGESNLEVSTWLIRPSSIISIFKPQPPSTQRTF
jgi:hypothetical protein